MNKIERIEKYLHDFFKFNLFEFDDFFITTEDQKREAILTIENGRELLNFLRGLNHYTKKLTSPKLVPHNFTTPDDLILYLTNLKRFIDEKSFVLRENEESSRNHFLIQDIIFFKNEIVKAIDYSLQIYDLEDENILLYQQLRHYLIKNDVSSFINDLKSISSSVSYPIKQGTEGFYHANVFLILKLLGFEIIPEDTTSIGRIDSVITFSKSIYILEFKFSNSSDDSDAALSQIIAKDYADKYRLERKPIYGIGVSFNENIRNIKNYKVTEL